MPLLLLAAAALCLTTPLAALAAKPPPQPRTSAASAPPTCPPPGFDSLPDFDLAAFVAAGPWYSLEQNEVFYQPKDALFCVRAAYLPRDKSGDLSKGLTVYNTARRGSVTGPSIGSSPTGGGFDGILAFPDPTQAARASPKTAASKLRVLPSFLEFAFKLKPSSSLISGPYWIVASSGPDLSAPDAWAVISGGPPTNPSGDDACRTGRAGPQTFLDINGSGLWLFARDPEAGAEVVGAARAAAANLGFDVGTLLPVQQKGCAYPPLPGAKTT